MNNYLKNSLVAVTVLITAAFAGLTSAASDAADTKAKMQKIDTDGDGKISRAEASSHKMLAKYFDEIDTNKDGFLSRDELKAHHAKKARAKFNAIDKDQDGRISRAEADAKAPKIAKNFDRIDTNKDGYISQDELAAVGERRKARAN
jgi:Ca2+-binding EF-hand superfamily protein